MSDQPSAPYYMLTCYQSDGLSFKNIESYPRFEGIDSWLLGRPIAIEIPQPIQLQWSDDTEGAPKKMYDANIPLAHKDIVASLKKAGVTNLQLFSTEIIDRQSNQVTRDYFAVNVLGLIAAADLANSEYRDPTGRGLIDMDFESLTIDPSKTMGAKLFRLAECVSGLVIAESVKNQLQADGGFGLQFVEPQDWIG